MKVEVGSLSFTSKKELEKFTRELLLKNQNKTISSEDLEWFDCLFKRHPKYLEKIGVGLKTIEVLPLYKYPNRSHINIIRTDNTKESISWLLCIKSPTLENLDGYFDLVSALRRAITGQIIYFKNNSDIKCNHCGKEEGDFEIDHLTPEFKDISEEFMKENIMPLEFDKHKKFYVAVFKPDDKELEKKWQDFHKERAVLQKLCVSCHRKKTKNSSADKWNKNNAERRKAYNQRYYQKNKPL